MGFIRRRIIGTIITFFIVVNLVFLIPRLAPGNYADVFASGTRLPAEAVKVVTARLGLDQPIYVQYVDYLKGIFTNWPPYFGISYEFPSQSVTTLIDNRILWTLLLIGSTFILAFLIGYVFAAISSLRRGGKFELGSMFSSILLWATPGFWLGMILIWVFAVTLHWFPVSGNISFSNSSSWAFAYSAFVHAVLPVCTLTAILFGQTYFLLRGASQSVLRSDFVLAAEARGLKSQTLSFKYIMRNSMLPVVSLLGYSIAALISSVVLVESVFSYPGIGDLIVDGIMTRDYPVLEGTFFYVSLVVLIGGLIGDFLVLRLDPRLRK
ncbi:MAG: ABC transporter permease [Nitrososphaerales archaeon]